MCSIIGYVGKKDTRSVLLGALQRLEYRGYDSAGIALGYSNEIEVFKEKGVLKNLEAILKDIPAKKANIGIGHTRWATHGIPSKNNAHPQNYGDVYLVHNGIIENYRQIKNDLLSKGHVFSSDTDTEVIAHLIDEKIKLQVDPIKLLMDITEILSGAFALAILINSEQEKIFFIRKNLSLVVGQGQGENFLASDQAALVDHDCRYYPLKDGEFGFITKDDIKIFNIKGENINPEFRPLAVTKEQSQKDGYKHFMQKEIFEQPDVINRVFLGRLTKDSLDISGFGIDFNKLNNIKRIHLIGCGSAYLAALSSKNDFEKYLKIPCEVEIASEFRYRDAVIDDQTLIIAISQSGETADTLAAIEKASHEGGLLLSLCNTVGSAITQICERSLGNIYLQAGPEISVASTKAFLAQSLLLKMLSLAMAKAKNLLSLKEEHTYVKALWSLIPSANLVLKEDNHIRDLAQSLLSFNRVLFIGRGDLYALALEGALKMKELSYIYAEGYAAGELKHGHIATIEPGTPVITLFSKCWLSIKTKNSAEEVKARFGKIIAIAPKSLNLQDEFDDGLYYDDAEEYISPLIIAIYLQLIAYHSADLRGLDVDKPRNLAKSVTVE